MIRRLAVTLTAGVLAAACGSWSPTAPSATPQASATLPPVQSAGSGPAAITGSPIIVGSSVQGTVEPRDPVCFPNWDSSGHCRQFDLTAPSDGTLNATLEWEGPSIGTYDPELFVISPDGAWVYAQDPWPGRQVSFQGSTGKTYRIVVIGYQLPLTFEVLVEVP